MATGQEMRHRTIFDRPFNAIFAVQQVLAALLAYRAEFPPLCLGQFADTGGRHVPQR